jgi:dienelactone hydrolase
MHWVNGAVRRLDDSIRAAARAAHALYADAYHAFAGHELCSAAPALDASFRPNRSGQLALGTLLARVLGAR